MLLTRIVQIIFCSGVTWGLLMTARLLLQDARLVRTESVKVDYSGETRRRMNQIK